MNLTPSQACAVAAVRLLREAGLDTTAEHLTTELISSELFCDEPIMPSLNAMLGAA